MRLPSRQPRAATAAALLGLVAVVALACGSSGPGSPGPGSSARSAPPVGSTGGAGAAGLATFAEGGLAFEYPAGWRVFHHQELSTASSLIAELSTVDVPEPCSTTPVQGGGTQVSCSARYRLQPDTLVVRVSANGWPSFNILDPLPAAARPLVVGGLPAYVEVGLPVDPATGADTVVTWTLARPGSVDNYYTISAALRGPDIATMRAQLDALVASLRFDPPATLLPAGQEAAATAAGHALAILASGDPSWRCFPTRPGTAALTVTALPMGPALSAAQVATCTMAVEATPLQLWKMTLTMALQHADANAGPGQRFTVWVGPDGTPGETSGGPLAP